MTDVGPEVHPIYFVPDQSSSMTGVIKEVNEGLTALLARMTMEVSACDFIRFGIVGFSSGAMAHLALSNLGEVEVMPTLTVYSSTCYSSVFIDLRQRIQGDVFDLRQQDFRVRRPWVFFVSDGAPDKKDDWRTSLAALKAKEFKFHPEIIAYGVDRADARIINEVASRPEIAFMADDGISTGEALAQAMIVLAESVMSSSQAIAQGNATVPIPKPAGFHLAADVLP